MSEEIIQNDSISDQSEYGDESKNEKNKIKTEYIEENNENKTLLLEKENGIDLLTNDETITNTITTTTKDNKSSNVLSNVDINIHGEMSNDDMKPKTCENNNLMEETMKENLDHGDNAFDIDPSISDEKQKVLKEEVENDPNFAIICSFFEKFGQYLEMKYSIKNLKTMFEDYNKVRPDLIDLHIKLLRKRRKYINKEKWQKALMRFCTEYSNIDAWELEKFGYENAKLSLRLRIFVRLLEAMFDYNQKFKSELNVSSDSSSLRVPAFGRDITGYTYWYQIDSDLNFRLYKDEPDEDNSWSLVSRNLNELNECIQVLKKQTLKDFKCISTPNSEESNSNPALLLLTKTSNQEDNQETIIEDNVDVDEKVSPIYQNKERLKDEIDPEDSSLLNKIDEIKAEIMYNEDEICERKEEINESEDEIKEETTIPKIKDMSPELNLFMNEMIGHVQSESEMCLDDEIKSLCETLLIKIEQDLEKTSFSKVASNRKPYRSKRGRGRGRRRGKSAFRNKSNKKDSSENKKGETTINDNQPECKENNQETVVKSEEKTTKSASRKRRSEIEKLKEDFAERLQAKRFSRRIQALQEKKLVEMQEEQKRLEKEMQEKRRKKEAAMAAKAAAMLAASLACDRSEDDDSRSQDHRKSKRRKKKKPMSDDDYQKESDDDEEHIEKKRKKRKRGKGKKGRKGANPWEDDSEDSEDEKAANIYEDDYDDILDDDNEELKFDDNEDEFACEEIDPNDEPVIIRRARTVKKSKDDFTDNNDFLLEHFVNDDKPCRKCGKYDNPHWILLCDKCDDGYHTSCLRPPLFLIPTGEWFCPPCEHKLLIEKLQFEYKRLSDEFDRQAFEKQKQKKRWRFAHCEISEENILEEDNAESTEKHKNEINEDDDVQKKVKSHKKGVKRLRPNGYLKGEEIEDALFNENDLYVSENSNYYLSEDDDEDDIDLNNEQSEDSEDDSDSDEISSGSSGNNSSDSEDEIGKCAFSDEDGQRYVSHHRKKKSKEKHIDINDYSRSGLKLRSARKRKPISYLFKEYDDLIKSAILQEEGAAEDCLEDGMNSGGIQPRSKGKDIANILIANAEMPDFSINPFETNNNDQSLETSMNKDQTDSRNFELNKEEKEGMVDNKTDDADDDKQVVIQKKQNVQQRRKQQKKKGLTNLDFSDDEEEEDHASDEDFKMADDDDELDEDLTEIEEEDNPDDETVTESDSDFRTSSTRRRSSRIQSRYSFRGSRKKNKKKKKKKKNKKSKRKFFVDSDEEEDDDDITSDDELIGGDSYSDESLDYIPRTRRAAKNKRFSYREDSSTEDELIKSKYQDDEDYQEDEYYDNDEEVDRKKSFAEQNINNDDDSSNPKFKPTVLTYSKECREKKRKRMIIEDDDDEDENNMADIFDTMTKTKKSKVDFEQILPPINKDLEENDDKLSTNKSEDIVENKSQATSKTIKSSNCTILTSQQKSTDISVATKSSKKTLNDQSLSSSYCPQQPPAVPSDIRFPSTSNDPLDSIKQMNSKFEYVTSPSNGNTVRPHPTQTPQQQICTTPKAPSYPSTAAIPTTPLHYQSPQHPYHPTHPVPTSSPYPPYNPSQSAAPNTPPNYSLPPQQQYLTRLPPPGPHQTSPYPPRTQPPHSIPVAQFQQPTPQHAPSPIRTNLPPGPHHQGVYNSTSLYTQQPPRYPVPPTTSSRPHEKDEGYTLTNLDSYNKKPSASNYPTSTYGPPNYTPSTPPQSSSSGPSASPPQILNLDSGNNSSFPTNYTTPSNNKHPPPPPHYYSGGHYENMVRPPAVPPPDYYSSPHQPPSQGSFYSGPPPPGVHPHQFQRMLPPPHASTNPYQQGPNSHYIPRIVSPRQQSPSSSPAYPPVQASNNIPPVATTSSSPTVRPPMIPSTTGSYTAGGAVYPYPHPYPVQGPYTHHPQYPPSASNGGFTIQNILLNRPPPPAASSITTATTTIITSTTTAKQVCAVKSAPTKATKSTPKVKKTTSNLANDSSKELVETNQLATGTSAAANQAKKNSGRSKKSKGQSKESS